MHGSTKRAFDDLTQWTSPIMDDKDLPHEIIFDHMSFKCGLVFFWIKGKMYFKRN